MELFAGNKILLISAIGFFEGNVAGGETGDAERVDLDGFTFSGQGR